MEQKKKVSPWGSLWLKQDNMTMDVYSTVITCHGSQDGVEKGINPKRHDRGLRHPDLSTRSFQCIAIGSYLIITGRKTTLKLSAKQNRRLFFEGVFSKVANLSP
ncbi:MAG: hypothetical protein PHN30_09935 [Bacteroidales bacterium]|jgi:hypothetical protein|nr:hypothetical protein [Candidatus Cloacimonadota bacterium]MDD2570426.1 hypothetical protein [Bacteroidales bacterium]MDD2812138.1 hypothetical protein [Bacteroidales bacterium]MDD3386021.1 hypothetical protein [Bacteroidales bacterium]MDD3811300.1 hypothetical protein [Bacteroidales bacterium]